MADGWIECRSPEQGGVMDRNVWVEDLVREFQVFAGICHGLPPGARSVSLQAFIATLPAPRSALEGYLLNGLLFTAERWCAAGRRRETASANDLLVERALALVDSRSPAHVTVEEIASCLAVHPRTLNRAFHAVHGSNVREALRARQLRTAEQLVAEMKVDAAAAMMGVSRTSLYRLFRARGVQARACRVPHCAKARQGAAKEHEKPAETKRSDGQRGS
jgi:AraC-like DNA-binding protein